MIAETQNEKRDNKSVLVLRSKTQYTHRRTMFKSFDPSYFRA